MLRPCLVGLYGAPALAAASLEKSYQIFQIFYTRSFLVKNREAKATSEELQFTAPPKQLCSLDLGLTLAY